MIVKRYIKKERDGTTTMPHRCWTTMNQILCGVLKIVERLDYIWPNLLDVKRLIALGGKDAKVVNLSLTLKKR
jgi:hypothetical protein